MLVDDSGKEHNTKFILASCGLSAGWRTFSFLHELKKGEILIFQLLGPCKLKVINCFIFLEFINILEADDDTHLVIFRLTYYGCALKNY